MDAGAWVRFLYCALRFWLLVSVGSLGAMVGLGPCHLV